MSTTTSSPKRNENPMLSRNDLNESIKALHNLVKTANSFRLALNNLSTNTCAFAKALEDCARLKGSQSTTPQQEQEQQQTSDSPFNPAQRLLAASGLHFISANLLQLLSITIQNSFESPLTNLYESYKQQINTQQSNYESMVSQKTKTIRETEIKNLTCSSSTSNYNYPSTRLSQPRHRDLNSFRKGLKELQSQVDQLESLKEAYYLQLAIGETEIWSQVAENISLVVKTEVEVFDRIASKPTSDMTLEWMTSMNPDPFEIYKPISSWLNNNNNNHNDPTFYNNNENETPEIYSILDPLSNLIQAPQAQSRSPSRVRKSLDLSQSLLYNHQLQQQVPASVKSSSPPPSSSSHSSSENHSHLNSTSHWATHRVPNQLHQHEEEEEQVTPPTSSHHPTSAPAPQSQSPRKASNTTPPETSIKKLPPSTNSSVTITSPPIADSSSCSSSQVQANPNNQESNSNTLTRKISSLNDQLINRSNLPTPRRFLLSSFDSNSNSITSTMTSTIISNTHQTDAEIVDNLLSEQPPNGLDLSDSDL